MESAKIAQIEKELPGSYTYIIEKTTFCYSCAPNFDLEKLLQPFVELNHGRKVTR